MKSIFYFIVLIFCESILLSDEKTLYVYHDSDYSNHASSAQSMFMGLSTAFDEVNNTVQGYRIELIRKDHRGNSVRSKLTMQQFLNDPNALFILGGLHSPPYIKFRDYINENEVLLLIPWAAGGPITRYDKGTNWVFRLSIDDTKAGDTIMDFAAQQLSCKQPKLLLENTPWGKSNFNTMNKAAIRNYQTEPPITWFNWNLNVNAARAMLRPVIDENIDCVLFVGNALEGEKLFLLIKELIGERDITVLSHWGITGGNFEQKVSHEVREKLNLHVLQTCENFNVSPLTEQQQRIFSRAKKLFPDELSTPDKLPAQTGFIHAYDLGKLVIAALNEIELSGDMSADRKKLRSALENINQPVNGLLKTYTKPFAPWTNDQSDAHEALGSDDFCMADYDQQNRLIIQND